ncbi:MAG: phosphoglycolate phosphatase [Candidatus Binatia bacterium]|nr:MAG: phosphoglycolate phosphatase [Candidatus Binatia bacterium]
MRFRAVIFDIGGVVVGSPLHAIAAFERAHGLPPGWINFHIARSGNEGAWARLERGELGLPEFVVEFERECRAAGQVVDAWAMMEAVQAATIPRPEMIRAIERIRESGLRAGAITNNWRTDAAEDAVNPLQELFDVFIESARLGVRKPDPRIYTLACEQLGVLPAQAVFLDDIGRNLKPARALGMATIKVEDPAAALAELEQLLGFPLVGPRPQGS